MRTLSRHLPRVLFLLATVIFATALQAEPARVDNGADPAQGLVIAKATEQWRAGGEDDEIFFGNVSRVAQDAEGNLLLLDSQLSQVQVYGTDGAHLRTVGREGDGPGEMRRPNDFFILPDGTICVLQGFGGRIVKIDAEGMPAGEGSFTPAQGSGQFSVMIRGLGAGQDMLLAGIKMAFEAGISRQTYFLTRCDAAGVEQATLVEKSNTIDYADFVMTEMDMDFVWSRMAVAPDGRVYAAPDRNAYEVQVFAADGSLERVIARSYEGLPRNDERKDIQRRIIEGIGANYPRPPRSIEIEDTDPVMTAMWVLDDGNLWVQTSRGDAEPPAGCWTVLDVFDKEGSFIRQVGLPGDHDSLRDGLHLMPDGRAVVVTAALDAYLSQQAVGGEEGDEEAEPLEIICYKLEI